MMTMTLGGKGTILFILKWGGHRIKILYAMIVRYQTKDKLIN